RFLPITRLGQRPSLRGQGVLPCAYAIAFLGVLSLGSVRFYPVACVFSSARLRCGPSHRPWCSTGRPQYWTREEQLSTTPKASSSTTSEMSTLPIPPTIRSSRGDLAVAHLPSSSRD